MSGAKWSFVVVRWLRHGAKTLRLRRAVLSTRALAKHSTSDLVAEMSIEICASNAGVWLASYGTMPLLIWVQRVRCFEESTN